MTCIVVHVVEFCLHFSLSTSCRCNLLLLHFPNGILSVVLYFDSILGHSFPFNYKEAKANGKIKYIFISTLVISFTFPLISLLLLKGGYFVSNFLFSSCVAKNRTVFHIVQILHTSLLMWLVVSVNILIIWRIFKVSVNNLVGMCVKSFAAFPCTKNRQLIALGLYVMLL